MTDAAPPEESAPSETPSTDERGGVFAWYRESTAKVRRVFWTCFAGWTLDSMDGLVYQYLIPVLIVGLGMTQQEAVSVASVNYFASALGGWTGGWLADRFGRARVLQITILWFSFFSFASGFAQDYNQLLILRGLQGLGFGAEWAVGAVLLGEVIASKHRGKAIGMVQSGGAIGSAFAALLAGPVVAMFPIEYGWRIVFWIGFLPALLVFFIRRGSDDSPLFAAARQRAKETGRTTSPWSIFHPRLLRITIPAALLAVGVQGAAFAVGGTYLTPFLQGERGLSVATAGIFVLMNSLGGFFGFATNAYLSDKLGRSTIFRVFGVGFVVTAAFYLLAPLGNSAFTLLPAGIVYGFFQFGMYASFGPYLTELFPTAVRGNGQAFSYNFGRASTFIFIQGVAILSVSLSLPVSMLLMGVAGVACVMIATLLLPETAGRDLAELDRRHDDQGKETGTA